MKSQLISLFALITIIGGIFYSHSSSEESLESTFNSWKQQFNIGKEFNHAENSYRMKIFQKTLKQIDTHNSLLGRSFDMGLNHFSALTKEQFAAQFLGTFQPNSNYVEVEPVTPKGPFVDWVSYGAVSPVKYQGSCTATYAFSAVGAIQGVSVIYYKNQQQYSVQQVIDCSKPYGNNGCTTGNMINVFNYVRNVGINTWASYPYKGYLGTCNTTQGYFRINGSVSIQDCSNLENALLGRPISVAVDGNNMQNYRSGIFSQCSTNLSLAVLLVGMTDQYWTLKNSWGAAWGENGYIRIYRGNTCGVCMAGSYPTV